MKIKKIIAGMAALMAAACMAVSASAVSIYDYVDPDKEPADGEKGYYDIGAMAFYMSQEWKWNQGDWCGIDENGQITVEYSINEVLTDTTMEGKGTLGDMGIMILNLPEGHYPYDMKVVEATFTPKEGDPITLQTALDLKGAYEDAESGSRIHLRPTDEVDDAGNITKPAAPELAGMDQPGAFKGGTLKIVVDFKDAPEAPAAGDDTPAAPADTDVPADNGPAATGAAASGAALAVFAGSGLLVIRRRK
ncbi:MAG: hypothetical protein IJ561_02065 [Ruminococcus sp.]|nr:hypothetical protein [Ruminococcus sp.]